MPPTAGLPTYPGAMPDQPTRSASLRTQVAPARPPHTAFATLCRALLGDHHRGLGGELDAALDRVRATAVEAWPGLALDDRRFADRVVRLIASDPAPLVALERLYAADLYLGVACAGGHRDALAALERDYLPELRGTLVRMGLSASSIDETLQVLREELLVARPAAPPRILGYSGRGPLRGWLRSVAARTGLREVRHPHRDVELDADLHAPGTGDLELDYLKRTYGEVFHDAFRAALGELAAQDRVLLRQRFRHRLTVEELGVMYGVHAGTISRRVTLARVELADRTRKAMMRRLGIDRDGVSSILRLIESQLELSLSAFG